MAYDVNVNTLDRWVTPRLTFNFELRGKGHAGSFDWWHASYRSWSYFRQMSSQSITNAGGITSGESFGGYWLLIPIVPDSDISLGNWKDDDGGTTDIYQTLDEHSQDDSDYVWAVYSAVPTSLEVGLENVGDPGVHDMHKVVYRYRKQLSGSPSAKLTVTLKQGTTTIASWVHDQIGGSWSTAEQVLTTEQAGSITDYNNLRLVFTAEDGS